MENIVEYAFILCQRGFIQLEHLPEYLLGAQTLRPSGQAGQTGESGSAGAQPKTPWWGAQPAPAQAVSGSPRTMAAAKLDAAREALRRHGGRVMAACRELDISKDTLRRILKGGGAD